MNKRRFWADVSLSAYRCLILGEQNIITLGETIGNHT